MNNKKYIGRRVSRYEGCGQTRAVDGVALVVDEEHEYRAGNMDGYVMEITCPYGTQAMADALLAQLRGRSYAAYDAENAVMDPEAELGDGVTINGTYTLLADRQMVFGSGHLCRIGAPADSEIDHEYGVRDTYDRKIERKLAQSRSYIDKTVDDIRIGVEGVQGDVAELEVSVGKISGTVSDQEGRLSAVEQTASGLTSTVSGQEGRLSQVEQTASGLTSTVSGLEGDVSRLEQTAGNITLSVTGSLGGKATIKLSNGSSGSIDLSKVRQAVENEDTDISITSGSMHFYNKTFMVNSDNLTITGDGTITADSAKLTFLTIYANSAPYVSTVQPYSVAATIHGNMYLIPDTQFRTASFGLYGAAGNGGSNVLLAFASNDSKYFGGRNCAVLGYDNAPTYINGSSIKANKTIGGGSDRDRKKDISVMPERYLDLLPRLAPKVFRYTDEDDTAPLHWGYIAQEVEAALESAGMTRGDMAALMGTDGMGDMCIGYTELIPLLHMKIRQLEQRLARLEAGT